MASRRSIWAVSCYVALCCWPVHTQRRNDLAFGHTDRPVRGEHAVVVGVSKYRLVRASVDDTIHEIALPTIGGQPYGTTSTMTGIGTPCTSDANSTVAMTSGMSMKPKWDDARILYGIVAAAIGAVDRHTKGQRACAREAFPMAGPSSDHGLAHPNSCPQPRRKGLDSVLLYGFTLPAYGWSGRHLISIACCGCPHHRDIAWTAALHWRVYCSRNNCAYRTQ